MRYALGFLLLAACSFAEVAQAQEPEANLAQPQHIVVLVDLGGFRWDYATHDGATNLLALGKSGVAAPQGMLPSYPSSTWPNAWTLVTGLYPGHHGIVADQFFDPARKARFSRDDPKAVADGSWFGGIPVWALAEKQGIRTACIAWPGCATDAGGARPALMPDTKSAATSAAKVQQISNWLRLPAADRPRFIAAYFGEVDAAGRRFGPDAAETRVAVRSLDAIIGKLRTAIDATHLPVNLIVVSDHGMAKPEGWITLDTQADLSGLEVAGPNLYGNSDAENERAYNQLKKASSEFVAYRLMKAPANLHLAANPRFGDPLVIALKPYALRMHAVADGTADGAPPLGIDGLNAQTVPEMKGIFFAAGPDIVNGRTVAPFENVNIYPWIAHLLNLTLPKNDGSLGILSGALRDGGDTGQ
jgi:alkaline phosphatase D